MTKSNQTAKRVEVFAFYYRQSKELQIDRGPRDYAYVYAASERAARARARAEGCRVSTNFWSYAF